MNMDNMDESAKKNAKKSDSAYSNSCSNSQSRRSSKSTHSGSHSSGSSGYGGKPSTPGYSTIQPPEKRLKENDLKNKNQTKSDVSPEAQNDGEILPVSAGISESPKEDPGNANVVPAPTLAQPKTEPESMDIGTSESSSTKDDFFGPNEVHTANASLNYVTGRPRSTCAAGFSCVISLEDGVVMYTTASLTTTLGFPRDMWIGRSFIDYVHPRDRNELASQITDGLALQKNTNGTIQKAQTPEESSMVCRIRRYRDLSVGFGVKGTVVTFVPFLLKLSFKCVNSQDGQATYLIIKATPFFSAFRTANELIPKPVPFIIRHTATGNLEYLDIESVAYLGYLPQDVMNKDTLLLYHPDDLAYLKEVYETIVKEGSAPRSKIYRMMTQNGDYLKLESEWTSFINPWSKKLEFVIGKHHVIEGPANPDVFQSPMENKSSKFTQEEKVKAKSQRESIVKILKEVLTKPAEAAKRQTNMRCKDLVSIMETLLEDQPKADEEMRVVNQDPDNSHCDSVMLGGISPHHDYNDGKSSTETPVSYNQLNYNVTLQRYFESHPSYSYEDYNTATGENIFGMSNPTSNAGDRMSPMAGGSDNFDSVPMTPAGDDKNMLLTEALLSKHNAEMEKELVKMHRESRSISKGVRQTSNEKRQKKKEHLARCNATFQPTSAGINMSEAQDWSKKAHGVKRVSNQIESKEGAHKHHCASPRSPHHKQPTAITSAGMNPMNYMPAPAQPMLTDASSSAITTQGMPMPYNGLPGHPMIGQMPGPTMPGHLMPGHMIPLPPIPGHSMFGRPMTAGVMPGNAVTASSMPENATAGNAIDSNPVESNAMDTSAMPNDTMAMNAAPNGKSWQIMAMQGNQMPVNPNLDNLMHINNYGQLQMPAVQCIMYGQPVYGTPFMYPAISSQVAYPMQQSCISQGAQYANNVYSLNPLSLATSNYLEACKPSIKPQNVLKGNRWRESKRAACKTVPIPKVDQESVTDNSSACRVTGASGKDNKMDTENAPKRLPDIASVTTIYSRKCTGSVHLTAENKKRKVIRVGNSEGTVEKTDEESSYSSFYSSFFKTESGSIEEINPKKSNAKGENKGTCDGRKIGNLPLIDLQQIKKIIRRKMEAPWMEHVCVSSELIYKYQICTKSVEEVLLDDKEKMRTLEQPALVNEQLGQLYLDLQLEGVAARLTLEEGVTSSSSSSEDASIKAAQSGKKRREYSKLVMIYEENAPLPNHDKSANQ